MTQEQYDRRLQDGNIDANAIYLTPDDNQVHEVVTADSIEALTQRVLDIARAIPLHSSATYVVSDAFYYNNMLFNHGGLLKVSTCTSSNNMEHLIAVYEAASGGGPNYRLRLSHSFTRSVDNLVPDAKFLSGYWYWETPNLVPGVEYATTELYNYGSVFVKLISVGGISAGSHKISHNTTMVQPLSLDMLNINAELISGSSLVTNLSMDRSTIYLNCTSDFGNVYFLIKYTK
jgi:hypothetical protein